MFPNVIDRNILLDRRDLVAAGSAADVVEFGPVPTGKAWEVWNVSGYNETGGRATMIVSVVRGTSVFSLDGVAITAANVPVRTGGLFLLPEGTILRVYFMTATAADVLHALLNGLEHPFEAKTDVARG